MQVGRLAVCYSPLGFTTDSAARQQLCTPEDYLQASAFLLPDAHHFGVPHAVCDELQARILVLAAERAEAVLRRHHITFCPAWQKPGAADIKHTALPGSKVYVLALGGLVALTW